MTSHRDELIDARSKVLGRLSPEALTAFWKQCTGAFVGGEAGDQITRISAKFADHPISVINDVLDEWSDQNKFFPHVSDIISRVKFYTWRMDRAIDRLTQLIEYDQDGDPSTKI